MTTSANSDPISSGQLLSQLNWRYATKSFDPRKKVSPEKIAALEEALVLSPSSFGLQPWKFIVIADQELKEALPAISRDQPQPRDCSHVVVLAVKVGCNRADVAQFVSRMAELRGVSESSLAGYESFAGGFIDKAVSEGWVDSWSMNQVYIALGQLLVSAAMLGVDACPMAGIQTEDYDMLLGLVGSGYATVLACPLGYRLDSDKYASAAKVRFSPSKLIERR